MKKLKYLILVCFAISCGTAGNEDDKTNFRIINVVSDSSSINVLVDEKPYIEGLSFGESLGYSDINTGSHDILATDENGFVPIVDSSISLSDKKDSTLLIFGTIADPESKILRDENDQPDDDVTKIRVIHAAQAIRSVDVYVISSTASIDALAPTVEGINFRSDSDYTFSTNGRYKIVLTDKKSKSPIFESDTKIFEAKSVYSIIIIDGQDTTSPNVLVLKDR